MSELEALKKECENLKNQLQQHSQAAQQMMSNLEAYKGELNDARAISLQLRANMVQGQKVLSALDEQVKLLNQQNQALQAKIDELTKGPQTDEPPTE